jgi:hypothetical protein
MNENLQNLTQFACGIFGGTILGILGFLTMTSYGGNAGCFAWADYITGLAGYESCGIVGAILGIVMGSLLGPIRKTTNYSHSFIIGLIVAAFVLPFIIGLYIFNLGGESGIVIAPAIIIPLVYILASAIVSGIILALRNWRNVTAYVATNKKRVVIISLASIALIILATISGIFWNKEARKQALTNPSRWEVYANDEYRFSLKFPEVFSYAVLATDDPYVNERNLDVVFAGIFPDELGLIFKVIKKPAIYTTLKTYVTEFESQARKNSEMAIGGETTTTVTPITLGGVSGFKVSGCDSYCSSITDYIFLEKGIYIYQIVYQYEPDDAEERIREADISEESKQETLEIIAEARLKHELLQKVLTTLIIK